MSEQFLTRESPGGPARRQPNAASALRTTGSVHVRQAIDREAVDRFRGYIDGCMHAIMSPDVEWHESLDRAGLIEFVERCGNFKLLTGNELGFPLLDIVGTVFATDILGAYCDYLECDEVAVSFEYAFARVLDPAPLPSDSPYHQDCFAVGADPIVNTWVTLDDAGDTAPGLEIVDHRVTDIYLPTEQPSSNHAGAELDAASVERLYGDYMWQPVCEAGDALVFDGRTIHRTWKTERMTQSRRSLEFRTMAVENMPGVWRANPHATFDRQGRNLSLHLR